jgi:hypothetical protein
VVFILIPGETRKLLHPFILSHKVFFNKKQNLAASDMEREQWKSLPPWEGNMLPV